MPSLEELVRDPIAARYVVLAVYGGLHLVLFLILVAWNWPRKPRRKVFRAK